ncbi:hypothetical protein DdX_19208 [Ditylenchus destructor]|uniref:Uncharacterized protein n=1 Tax=Ditylenchus destructor TaxID=166010 RepID=A0AAD4MJK2_9BILA|nr:hypothetical protein DdX_19208 [Ditylenchus destructor]
MQKNIPCKCLIIPAIALLVVIIYDEYMQANNAKGIKVVGASNQHLPSVVQPVPQDRRRITKRRTNPPSHSKIAQSVMLSAKERAERKNATPAIYICANARLREEDKELYKIHGKWPNDPRTYITEKYEDRHLNKIAKDKHGMVFVFRESDVKVLHHQIKKHGPRQAFGGRIDEESIAEQMPVYKNGIPVISGSDAIKLRKWATKPADAVEELGLSPWIGSHSSSELRFVRIPPGHVMRSNLRLLNGNENGINRGMFEPGGRAPGGAHFRMAKLDWYPYGLIALLPEYRWGEHFSSEKLKQD